MPEPSQSPARRRFTFPRTARLTHAREFDAVYGARLRKSLGPLTMYARPSETGRVRLGLAVGRRVGNAVERNRIKRLLREAFRLSRQEFLAVLRPAEQEAAAATGAAPGTVANLGYDIVIGVHAHEPLALPEYQRALVQLLRDVHETALRRATRKPREGS